MPVGRYHHRSPLALQSESLVSNRPMCDGLMHVGMSPNCTANTFIDRELFTTSIIIIIIILSWFSIRGQLVAGN